MKKLFFIMLLLILAIGCVSATDSDDLSNNLTYELDNQEDVADSTSQDLVGNINSNEIIVNDWEELQYYCSLKDEDYTLKLKENTNYYPTNPTDSNYQIKVYNNVKIIGNKGAYIGDSSGNPRSIAYTAIVVPDNYKSSIYLENVTFKWIYDNQGRSDAVFLQIGGQITSTLKNCDFQNINVDGGHSTIVYLRKGSAVLENCSFIKCTTDFGCVSVYDPNTVKNIKMVVRDCYFENNYARTAPGCINNCGILEVYNSTFYKNRAHWWAGAIHTHQGGNTTIYDSNFTDNVAGWNGGALYTYSYLNVYNTIFVGNNCTTNNGGGAIGACKYLSDPHIYVKECLFDNNANLCWDLDELSTTGTGRGGAISLMDKGSITVLDSTFIKNSASIGTAICAFEVGDYGSPDIIIKGNTFINHTRAGDLLIVRVAGTILDVSDNYYYGNSIELSNLFIETVSVGKDTATFKITPPTLNNPSYYDSDILDKTLYEVFVNGVYKKTVNSTVFSIDFDDLDICDVYVVPTISNYKSNMVTVASTREYIFVSKTLGNDDNDGLSRDDPVNTIKKALQLANGCQSILILDGEYDEGNLEIDYDLLIKGENNPILSNTTSFVVNNNQFTIKNLNIVNISVDEFIHQDNGNLTIDNCVFNNDHAVNLFNVSHVEISKSIFMNNDACLVYNNGFALIKNSILLNNNKILDGDVENINLDYNWWGNTLNDLSKPSDLNINNWLILNISSAASSLEQGKSASVYLAFYLFEDSQSAIIYNDLKDIVFNVVAVNGTSTQSNLIHNSKTIYTLTEISNGSLTISYNNIEQVFVFDFVQSSPDISVDTNSIQAGEDIIIQVKTPSDATGNITINMGLTTLTQEVSESNVFAFRVNNAGDYTLVVNYTGDNKYLSQVIQHPVSVSRKNSSCEISIGEYSLGGDVIVTVTTNDDTTGRVVISVNGKSETLILSNQKVTYTIKSISRGDYVINAYYQGNTRYLPCESTYVLEVDNIHSSIEVFSNNITYGEVAVFNVKLNDNATGNVSVSVDGITNTSSVLNGQANVYLSGINAGINKSALIFYTGDNTYYNLTVSSLISVFKADFSFDIDSKNIKIGQDAVINIRVPPKTEGTFTIGGVVLNIPMSGEISYLISDLEIGNYTVYVTYNGNNYNTVENSTSFSVFEYANSQWANEGADTQNTQKSQYSRIGEGNILWSSEIGSEISGNLVIDSEGNVYLIAASGINSFDSEGNLRWVYGSDDVAGSFSGLSVIRDVVLSPKLGDKLYLINQNTGELYGSSNIYQASSSFSMIVDLNATGYVVSEFQYETNSYNLVIVSFKSWENGGNPVLVNLGNAEPISSPSVSDDLIVVLCDNQLRVIDSNSLNTIFIKTGNFKNIRPVIGEGNIVYAILGDSVLAYTLEGAQLWKTEMDGGAGNQLLLDNDLGVVYATNAKGNLYSYDIFNGEETLISDLSITSGVLIDANHNLYFGCGNMFYAIDSNGNVLWKTDLGSKVTGNPVMNKNGTIYVTTQDNKLFALGNSTGVVNDTNSSSDTNSTPESGTNSTPSNVNPSNGGGNSGTSSTTKVVKKASKITAKKKTFKKSLKTKKYTVTLKSGKTPIKKVKLIIKIGRKTFKATTNAKGKATFKIKKLTKKGKYTAKITFKGNKYYKATTKKVKIVLK